MPAEDDNRRFIECAVTNGFLTNHQGRQLLDRGGQAGLPIAQLVVELGWIDRNDAAWILTQLRNSGGATRGDGGISRPAWASQPQAQPQPPPRAQPQPQPPPRA